MWIRLKAVYGIVDPTKENGEPPKRDEAGRPLEATPMHVIDLDVARNASPNESADARAPCLEPYVMTVGRISHVKGT